MAARRQIKDLNSLISGALAAAKVGAGAALVEEVAFLVVDEEDDLLDADEVAEEEVADAEAKGVIENSVSARVTKICRSQFTGCYG